MMTKINQELSRQRNKVNHLTLSKLLKFFISSNILISFLANEKYNQIITRLIQ